jgi:hypothetical protein
MAPTAGLATTQPHSTQSCLPRLCWHGDFSPLGKNPPQTDHLPELAATVSPIAHLERPSTRSSLGIRRSHFAAASHYVLSASLSTGSGTRPKSCRACVLACSGSKPGKSRTEPPAPVALLVAAGPSNRMSGPAPARFPWPKHCPRPIERSCLAPPRPPPTGGTPRKVSPGSRRLRTLDCATSAAIMGREIRAEVRDHADRLGEGEVGADRAAGWWCQHARKDACTHPGTEERESAQWIRLHRARDHGGPQCPR